MSHAEAGVDIILVRDLVPSPHVAEQSPQLPKSPHTQSTKLGNLIWKNTNEVLML